MLPFDGYPRAEWQRFIAVKIQLRGLCPIPFSLN